MSRDVPHLNAVLDSLADHAILTLDLNGTVTSWNRAAEKTKGYSEAEIIGRNFDIFYPEADRAAGAPRAALDTALKDGRFETEGWRLRKDGQRFWANVVIQPLRGPGGDVEGFVKVTRDISDRLAVDRLQDELQQSQKLELVGQLTGGVAHDFNNLLTVIESTFELIRVNVHSEKIDRFLEINRVAIDRSRRLIGQLLAFSRKQVLNAKISNVNDVVSVFDELLQKAVGEQIQIAWNLNHELPSVNVDSGHLQSALMNLVINARDAMPNGGSLTVSTHRRMLGENAFPSPFDVPAGHYVVIAVTDTGIGMTPDVARRAVEPFFTTKDVGRGTGLGLSQCFGFARQSGGTLIIDSQPGVGTTVSIWLPVGDAGEVAEPSVKTVLLVEDDPAVRELAGELLRAMGNRVIEAADAGEALARLEHDLSIDVLFTDVIMPNGINGVQLVLKAREMRPGLPAVLTSGYTRTILRDTADLPDDTPLLRKPYTLDDLRDSLAGRQAAKVI